MPANERSASQGPQQPQAQTEKAQNSATSLEHVSVAVNGALCFIVIADRTFGRLKPITADDRIKFHELTAQSSQKPVEGTGAYDASKLATVGFYAGAYRFLRDEGTRSFLPDASAWQSALFELASIPQTAPTGESADMQQKRRLVADFARNSWDVRDNLNSGNDTADFADIAELAAEDAKSGIVIWAESPKPGEQAHGYFEDLTSPEGSARFRRELKALTSTYDPDFGAHVARRHG